MSALCPILRGSFEDYRRDALPAPQRRILREHLSVCAECRALAASEDPTMLFARPFAAEALPEDESRRILENVRTAVAFAQTESRLRRTIRRRRRAAAAAAAAAAFGGLLLMTPGGETVRVETHVAAIEESGEARPAPAAGDAAAELAAPPEVSASFAPLPSPVQPAALETEGVSNDATVYEWSPGAGREEPRVVWIVDRGLDI